MKTYILLKTPRSVDSKKVKDEILKHLKAGKKTGDIAWRMEFVTTDELVKKISNQFRINKNKIAFNYRK